MLKTLLIILFLSLGEYNTEAQRPSLNFNYISTDNGLSHNKVNCILQDKRGFIWIGTEDGLNRYDGRYFSIYRNKPNDTSTISGNIITDILEDENEILWIATSDGGLTSYDYKMPANKKFKQFKHISEDSTTIPSNSINKLAEDKLGYLWLATSGSVVLRFNKVSQTFEMPVESGTRTVASLAVDQNGILWAGRIGGSFLKINTVTLEFETDDRYNNLYAKLPHASITSVFRDSENHMWFGSWDNLLYRYNAVTKKEEVFKKDSSSFSFPDDEVQSFAEDEQQRIWMGGKYYGLTIYDKGDNKFYNYRNESSVRNSLADNCVNCVYVDKSGIVWLGTNKGLCTYDPSQQNFTQTFLPFQNKGIVIYDFHKYSKDELWLGTSDGIYKHSATGGFELKKIYYNDVPLLVSKFFKDSDGTLYIGTQYSLFIYHPGENKVTLLENTGKDLVMKKIIDSRVVSVVRDTIANHPVLLVSPYGHFMVYYDLIEKKWVSRLDSTEKIVKNFNLKDNLIRKFYVTSSGNIWLGNAKFGLGEWKRNSLPRVQYLRNNPVINGTISNDNVYDILEDPKGNLWVSTYGGGLNYFNTSDKNFMHIQSSNNLLEGIQTDVLSNVWMISNGNIQKYDPFTKKYSSYLLPDMENTGGIKGYIFKDEKGFLYVAGVNYFIKFNPLQIKEMISNPNVYFTDFKIFDSSHSDLIYKNKIELKYFQNYFSIEFAAPQFTASGIQYVYMLEGLDKGWVEAGHRNLASYANLKSGQYNFKVKAVTGHLNPGGKETSLLITIAPPFWEKWWFYMLIASIIFSGAYMLYGYRINELLKRQMVRNKIAQDLHDQLGSTLSSISVYSQVAKIYQHKQEEEKLQHTLEKITETSSEMIVEMSDIVWAINPRNDHMNTIIQRMETYARPLAQAKNIGFHFSFDPLISSYNLGMEKRKNFFLIYKEAINNAFKYSECSFLNVEIRSGHHQITLQVRDNGKGFVREEIEKNASESLSGNGLKNMQMRAKEMKASFLIESSPGKGTSVFLTFRIP